MSLRTVKRLKAGSITREPGSGRPQKLIEAHKSFILILPIILEIGLQSNYETNMELKLTGRLSLDF